MIKGRYVATVTFDFHIVGDAEKPVFINAFKNTVNESVKELLEEYVGNDVTVTVEQQMCDIYAEAEEVENETDSV